MHGEKPRWIWRNGLSGDSGTSSRISRALKYYMRHPTLWVRQSTYLPFHDWATSLVSDFRSCVKTQASTRFKVVCAKVKHQVQMQYNAFAARAQDGSRGNRLDQHAFPCLRWLDEDLGLGRISTHAPIKRFATSSRFYILCD